MDPSAAAATIEVVRDHLPAARAEDVLALWAAHGEAGGAERLGDVVALVIGPGGELAGLSAATAADVALLAGRRLWVQRSLLPGPAAAARPALLRATFDVLEAEFDPEGGGPLGLCVPGAPVPGDEPVPTTWDAPPAVLAGRGPDGGPVHVAWFAGASIGPAPAIPPREPVAPPGVRIARPGEAGVTDDADLVAFWLREGALDEAEATRRAPEVLFVATDAAGDVIGVASTYLAVNAQLGAPLWHMRGFVGAEHRRSDTATLLGLRSRDHLREEWASGRDRRGAGILYVVESPGLRDGFSAATWRPIGVTFVGEDARGAHLRVDWFAGAALLLPPLQGST
jgi:hypothetical protein